MKRVVVLLVAFASLLFAADRKRKPGKPPEVEVVEVVVQRVEGKVTLDGLVRNVSESPIEELVLVFDFLEPDDHVVTRKEGPLEEELLEPGQEAVFQFQTRDPVRAVRLQVNAVAKGGRELRVAKPGPFPIQ